MIREERMLISKRPYAVNLLTLFTNDRGGAEMDAVWFRRRSGVTVACVGILWDYQSPSPTTAYEFLRRHDDGRYGGDCRGRWDGERYWGAQEPEVIQEHLDLLRPMLEAYPGVPNGYDGWWRF